MPFHTAGGEAAIILHTFVGLGFVARPDGAEGESSGRLRSKGIELLSFVL